MFDVILKGQTDKTKGKKHEQKIFNYNSKFRKK